MIDAAQLAQWRDEVAAIANEIATADKADGRPGGIRPAWFWELDEARIALRRASSNLGAALANARHHEGALTHHAER